MSTPFITDVFLIDKGLNCNSFDKTTYSGERKLIEGPSHDLFKFEWGGIHKGGYITK